MEPPPLPPYELLSCLSYPLCPSSSCLSYLSYLLSSPFLIGMLCSKSDRESREPKERLSCLSLSCLSCLSNLSYLSSSIYLPPLLLLLLLLALALALVLSRALPFHRLSLSLSTYLLISRESSYPFLLDPRETELVRFPSILFAIEERRYCCWAAMISARSAPDRASVSM